MTLFTLPSASPKQTLVQDFGLGKISITYSRPSLRGRTVFGENSLLAPLNLMWRTGADACTLITFSDYVSIHNIAIEPGTYSLFSIPGATNWELILNKGNKSIGAYNKEEDLIRFSVPVTHSETPTETFTINLQHISYESCSIQLAWAHVVISFTINTDIVERLKSSYEAQLASENKPHFPAANFYHLLGNDNARALDNVEKALATNPEAYYMHYLKSLIEASIGNKEAAVESAHKTLVTAIAANSNDYKRLAENMLLKLS